MDVIYVHAHPMLHLARAWRRRLFPPAHDLLRLDGNQRAEQRIAVDRRMDAVVGQPRGPLGREARVQRGRVNQIDPRVARSVPRCDGGADVVGMRAQWRRDAKDSSIATSAVARRSAIACKPR